MKIAKVYYILFSLILISSCSKTPKDIENALLKAGKNKAELQKVIDHYKNSGRAKEAQSCILSYS